MKLNIGCGDKIRFGWVNLDRIGYLGVNVIHDLERYPYPFKDNTFSDIHAEQVIEHLEKFHTSVNELIRILRPEGVLKMIVPHFSDASAHHPYHKRYFSCEAFRKSRFGKPRPLWLSTVLDVKVQFYKGKYFWNYIIEPLVNWNDSTREIWENTGLHNIFPATLIHVVMKK